jgi:hypothetical protein
VRAQQTYEISFLGQANSALRAEFEDCEVTVGHGTTTLRTDLPDQGALTGLMDRISGLGLEIIDVSLVAPPPELEASRGYSYPGDITLSAGRHSRRHARKSVQ